MPITWSSQRKKKSSSQHDISVLIHTKNKQLLRSKNKEKKKVKFGEKTNSLSKPTKLN